MLTVSARISENVTSILLKVFDGCFTYLRGQFNLLPLSTNPTDWTSTTVLSTTDVIGLEIKTKAYYTMLIIFHNYAHIRFQHECYYLIYVNDVQIRSSSFPKDEKAIMKPVNYCKAMIK